MKKPYTRKVHLQETNLLKFESRPYSGKIVMSFQSRGKKNKNLIQVVSIEIDDVWLNKIAQALHNHVNEVEKVSRNQIKDWRSALSPDPNPF